MNDTDKIIELDLTGCKYLYEIHERIRVAFSFPESYGKNWDAFWDLLWSKCDADQVIIKGESSLPSGFAEQMSIMHAALDDNVMFRRENHLPPFSYKIIN